MSTNLTFRLERKLRRFKSTPSINNLILDWFCFYLSTLYMYKLKHNHSLFNFAINLSLLLDINFNETSPFQESTQGRRRCGLYVNWFYNKHVPSSDFTHRFRCSSYFVVSVRRFCCFYICISFKYRK